MKLTLKSCCALLVLIMPLSCVQINQANAASDPSFSSLQKITNQATLDAWNSDEGEYCVYQNYKSTVSYSRPPEIYSGSEGDLWVFIDDGTTGFPGEQTNYFWDSSSWIHAPMMDDASTQFGVYAHQNDAIVRTAQKSEGGFQCVISGLLKLEFWGQEPPAKYSGMVGDLYINFDSKFHDAQLYFIWSGLKWIANRENPYTLAHAVATRTKDGEFCIYEKNRDVYSSYYSAPPSSYKGVKGDLWIVADKISGRAVSNSFWDGKSWLKDSAPGAIPLKKINDAVQYKARNSATGEVCHAGTNVSTQTFNAKLPTAYKGKANDRWIVMDKKGDKSNIYYYWTGKSWVLN